MRISSALLAIGSLLLSPACAASTSKRQSTSSQPHTSAAEPLTGFRRLEPGVLFQEHTDSARGKRLWLYVPESRPGATGLPLVIVPAAGSNLLTGMTLSDGDRAEHLPYVRAGFAVVSFDVSGALPSTPSEQAVAAAVNEFIEARLGAQDGVAALNRALELFPDIDRSRIYLAGHSSAATLVLQIAAEEPRVAGVAAYAPVSDVGWWLYDVLKLGRDALTSEIANRSPLQLADKLTRPVFLFHATGDQQVPVAQSRQLATRLRELGRSPAYLEHAGGDHYQAMLAHGIPSAIQWFGFLANRQPGFTPPSGPIVDASAYARGGDPARALNTYRSACEQRQWEACLNAGTMIALGLGADVQPQHARAMLEQACSLEVQACNEAGRVMRSHLRGEGSYEVFRSGCERGDQDACVNQGRALENGLGDDRPDPAAARSLYVRACELEHAEGCYMAGSSFADANFGPVDHDKEQDFLRRACDLGMERACREVREEQTRTGPVFVDMLNAIYAHERAVIACAHQHGVKDRSALPLTVTFSSSGKLVDAQITEPALDTPPLMACIRKALQQVQLEPFKDPSHVLRLEMKLDGKCRAGERPTAWSAAAA